MNKGASGIGAYIAVTAAYWAFMLGDGALRMLVLLHFHGLGFSPVQLAYLFVLYEVAGILTNLYAGWIGARFGLAITLYAGLAIQIAALLALALLDPRWSIGVSVVYVMAVQGASGVAKDLTKMSAKSAVKLLAPQGDHGLFRYVAALTGSKNAIKGFGFLVGAALLATLGFQSAVLIMAATLLAVLVAVTMGMPPGLPAARKSAKFAEVFSTNAAINRLSLARVFLFGGRDAWFVVGIPVYFYAVLSDGSPGSDRQAFFLIGGFMALWVILYGAVQSAAPAILRAKGRTPAQIADLARRWAAWLVLIPALLTGAALIAPQPALWLTVTLVLGLLAFGAVFAINSALHSYLILAFSDARRVSMDVGFYYMANAAGRLLGTVLSGLSYQLGGLAMVLATATGLIAIAWVASRNLGQNNLRTEVS